jgi:hypothetical protein
MTTREEVREIEKKLQEQTPNKQAQMAILSKAQGLLAEMKDEHAITLLAIVKNRIIHNRA